MVNRRSLLTQSADVYCSYYTGYVMATQGRERAEEIAGKELDSRGAIALASEIMYDGAKLMVSNAMQLFIGVSKTVANKSSEGLDDEIAAHAVIAVDLAFNRYASRLEFLGDISVATQVLRPCIVKQRTKVPQIRRSRTDKIQPVQLSVGVLHKDYEEYAHTPICDLIVRN